MYTVSGTRDRLLSVGECILYQEQVIDYQLEVSVYCIRDKGWIIRCNECILYQGQGKDYKV